MDSTTENPTAAAISEPHAQPKGGPASNFARPALCLLQLSTKSSVWGDASWSAIEPTEGGDRAFSRSVTLQQHHNRCMFCGLQSIANEIHNRNDNHRDVRPENLGVADAICHRWQHLGEIEQGDGLLVYLPKLAAQDVSHLLRTILVALQSDEAAARDDGRRLLNWMASHHRYVVDAWGTSDPREFATAITRTAQEDRSRKALAFEHLALVLNPKTVDNAARQWAADAAVKWPTAAWPRVHHGVMNAPT
jgi:intracellular multiplication protein IcmJ